MREWEAEGVARVLDLPLGFDPPSSPPPCEQEAVRSRGSCRVWGLQRPGADRVEASWLAFSPQGPEGLVGGVWEGSNWVGPLGLCRWGWGLGSASGALSKGRAPLPRARASTSSHGQKASFSGGTPCCPLPSSEQKHCCGQGGTGTSNPGDSTVSVCVCVRVRMCL